MILEQYVAHLNSLAFWKEFTFAQNTFAPRPGAELELADNLVWLEDHAFVLQLKERKNETADPNIERAWFANKVLKKAVRQVRDSLSFLEQHQEIRVTNERGHSFDIKPGQIADITKIIVYLGGRSLPEDCWATRHYVSQTAGFIHVVASHDYLGILEKLRVPEDIRRYFAYRQEVLPKLHEAGIVVEEADVMGGFLNEEDLPFPGSQEVLRRFVQDHEAYDLSGLIGSLHDHIERTDQPYDYYAIMLEFARVPRSVWREIKLRFMKSLEAVENKAFTRPFRLTFPETGCTFMIMPMDPDVPATGQDGEQNRIRGLTNLTYAAMYDAKMSKGVGVLISKTGDYFQIDWSKMDVPWAQDLEVEAWLAESNPFRVAKEKMIDAFFFCAPEK